MLICNVKGHALIVINIDSYSMSAEPANHKKKHTQPSLKAPKPILNLIASTISAHAICD